MEDLIILEIENINDYPKYIDDQNPYWGQSMLNCSNPFIYIFALIEKTVVGVTMFSKTQVDTEWFHSSLSVAEHMRRRGISQKMIESGIKNLRTKGVKKIYAYIAENNIPSINLHKKLLFQPSENQKYIKSSDENMFFLPKKISFMNVHYKTNYELSIGKKKKGEKNIFDRLIGKKGKLTQA